MNKRKQQATLLPEKVFQKMTSATQTVAKDFEAKLGSEKRDALLMRHEMGLRLADIGDHESTYGSAAVDQIAAYLGVSSDRLYKLRKYSQVYSRDQIELWADRKMESGGRLAFNHLAAIMVVKSEEERMRLVEDTFEQSLSVRKLRRRIDPSEGREPIAGKGGLDPRSIVGGLHQLITRSKTLLKGFPAWRKTVFDEIDQADVLDLEPIVRNRVIEAQNVLDELTTAIDTAIARLAGNLERTIQASRDSQKDSMRTCDLRDSDAA